MKPLIFILLIISHLAGFSQYVAIKDSSVKKELRSKFPNCFNAMGLMDTTCKEVVSCKSLNFGPVSAYHLEDLRYFDSLSSLTMCAANLYQLSYLPMSLKEFVCLDCNLVGLPEVLPPKLEILDCGSADRYIQVFGNFNFIKSLPALPATLKHLNIEQNGLETLPDLPKGLKDLLVSRNHLTSLPKLPDSLKRFEISYNRLTSLPAIPDNFTALVCEGNKLKSLPSLPKELRLLKCGDNEIEILDNLPPNLTFIECSFNKITKITSLPSNLKYLDCSHNLISELLLSDQKYLKELHASNNNLIHISLSDSLELIDISLNKLLQLPILPPTLITLKCFSNPINNLGPLPKNLMLISVDQKLKKQVKKIFPKYFCYTFERFVREKDNTEYCPYPSFHIIDGYHVKHCRCTSPDFEEPMMYREDDESRVY